MVGIPVLSLLYATNLSTYKTEFLLLLISGSFLAFQAYLRTVLTVMRKQQDTERIYLITAVCAFVLMNYAVNRAGSIGSAVCFTVILALLTFGLFFMYRFSIESEGSHETKGI